MIPLPHDIILLILDFDGRSKYRHGKFMRPMSKLDKRYQMLQDVPKKEHRAFSKFILMNENRFIIFLIYIV